MTLTTIWESFAIVSREPSSGIELSELGESHARDFSDALSRSSHIGIMYHDGNSVRGDMHV